MAAQAGVYKGLRSTGSVDEDPDGGGAGPAGYDQFEEEAQEKQDEENKKKSSGLYQDKTPSDPLLVALDRMVGTQGTDLAYEEMHHEKEARAAYSAKALLGVPPDPDDLPIEPPDSLEDEKA